jgi:hypothetical protein
VLTRAFPKGCKCCHGAYACLTLHCACAIEL